MRFKSWAQSKQLVSQDILSLCPLFLLLVGLPERRCTDSEETRRPKWARSFYGIRNIDTCWIVRGILVLLKINDKGQNLECLPCTFFSSFFACTVHSEHYQQLCYPPSTCISTNMNTAFDLGRGNIRCTSEAKGELKSVPSVSNLCFVVLVPPPHCLLLGIFARTGGGSSRSRGATPSPGMALNRIVDGWMNGMTKAYKPQLMKGLLQFKFTYCCVGFASPALESP